jgi:hypothetical protein
MNVKKTGKLVTVIAATAALIASLVNDKKSKNINK